MKKGIAYIEGLLITVISIIFITSISKLIFTGVNIIKSAKEKGKALDIVRDVNSLYKNNRAIDTGVYGIEINTIGDFYSYLEKGNKPLNGDFTLYTVNSFEENIDLLSIKLVSNENKFEDIKVIVTK